MQLSIVITKNTKNTKMGNGHGFGGLLGLAVGIAVLNTALTPLKKKLKSKKKSSLNFVERETRL